MPRTRSYAALLSVLVVVLTGCQPTLNPNPIPDAPPSASPASTPAKALPSSAATSVPFSPQAPFANWDAAHEEACEEMSLIMVVHALNRTALAANDAERELQKLLAWEVTHGYGVDVTIEQLGRIARDAYGIRSSILSDVSEESLERAIAAGRPVILPIAGRELGNPYFSGEGPWYHMLIVTGYRHGFFGQTIFKTNDPGTKRGEGYEYSASTLVHAVHDWTGVKEEIDRGQRKMLVVESKSLGEAAPT